MLKDCAPTFIPAYLRSIDLAVQQAVGDLGIVPQNLVLNRLQADAGYTHRVAIANSRSVTRSSSITGTFMSCIRLG